MSYSRSALLDVVDAVTSFTCDTFGDNTAAVEAGVCVCKVAFSAYERGRGDALAILRSPESHTAPTVSLHLMATRILQYYGGPY